MKTDQRSLYQETYTQAAKQQMNNWQKGFADIKAMWRIGHDEISHALKAFPDSIPITPEPGAMGEPTPQEVFADKQGKSPLEMYQKDMYTPKLEIEKEPSR